MSKSQSKSSNVLLSPSEDMMILPSMYSIGLLIATYSFTKPFFSYEGDTYASELVSFFFFATFGKFSSRFRIILVVIFS